MKRLFLPYWTHKFQAFYISLAVSVLALFFIYQTANAMILEPVKLENENFSMQIAQFVAQSQPQTKNLEVEPQPPKKPTEPMKEEVKPLIPKKHIKKLVKKDTKKDNNKPQISQETQKDIQEISKEVAKTEKQETPSNIAPKTPSNIAQNLNLPQTLTYGKTSDERLRKIKMAIEEAGYYPRKARKMRLSGEVWVEFLWLKNGILKDLKIKKSSSHDVLDEGALQTIKTASREFPKLEKDIRLEVPIVYNLVK